MKKLLELLTPEEKKMCSISSSKNFDIEMAEYLLLSEHYEDLSFEQYAELSKIKELRLIQNTLESVLDKMSGNE